MELSCATVAATLRLYIKYALKVYRVIRDRIRGIHALVDAPGIDAIDRKS
jgi:hypothetical protein